MAGRVEQSTELGSDWVHRAGLKQVEYGAVIGGEIGARGGSVVNSLDQSAALNTETVAGRVVLLVIGVSDWLGGLEEIYREGTGGVCGAGVNTCSQGYGAEFKRAENQVLRVFSVALVNDIYGEGTQA